jgi:cob(I)alamin adenosyltransferase
MTITTKRGDKGKTTVLSSKTLDKDNILIEVIGTIDELNSFLGLTKSGIKSKRIDKIVSNIQKNLALISVELSLGNVKGAKSIGKLNKKNIVHIESLIESFEKGFEVKSFLKLDSNSSSAGFNVTRTISRRLERRAVSLKKSSKDFNKYILIYLNRLSDLLFLLARSFN